MRSAPHDGLKPVRLASPYQMLKKKPNLLSEFTVPTSKTTPHDEWHVVARVIFYLDDKGGLQQQQGAPSPDKLVKILGPR
jgi:hypothetical protein